MLLYIASIQIVVGRTKVRQEKSNDNCSSKNICSLCFPFSISFRFLSPFVSITSFAFVYFGFSYTRAKWFRNAFPFISIRCSQYEPSSPDFIIGHNCVLNERNYSTQSSEKRFQLKHQINHILERKNRDFPPIKRRKRERERED